MERQESIKREKGKTKAHSGGSSVSEAALRGAQSAERARGAKSERSNRERREILTEGIRAAVSGTMGYIFASAQMLFGTYPLGFALIAASGREVPFVLLGVILGTVFGANDGGLALFKLVGACVTVMLRIFARFVLDRDADDAAHNENGRPVKRRESKFLRLADKLSHAFSEHTYLRMMSGAVGVFFVGISSIVKGGFRFYDLFGAIFYLVLTPLCVFFFSPFFVTGERKRMEGTAFSISVSGEIMYDLSKLLLASATVYSLGGVSVAGISLRIFLSVLLSLSQARRSLFRGTVTGLALGLSGDPVLAPVCALAALGYASLSKLSVFGGSVAACLSGLVWCIYVGGFSSLAEAFPALLSSTMIFCTASKIGAFDDLQRFFEASESQSTALAPADVLVADERLSLQDERLRSISDSFSTLSEIFYNLSSKLKRPTTLDLRHICEENFERSCEKCEGRELCYGAEYGSTLDVMKKMTVSLHSFGTVDEKKLPESFKKRCAHTGELTENINHACSVATKRAFQNEKTEIFALDYDAIAKILNDAIAENEDEFRADSSLGKKLSRAIADEGYGEHSVVVFGKRKLRILARGLDLSDSCADVGTLKAKLEAVTGACLTDPTFELSHGSVNMHTEARRAFSVKSAFVTSRADGESICGDCVSIFENKNDYLYALISDGMGKGHSAALVSEMCNAFLRNMLTAGNRMETSLRMLNSVVRAKGSDSERECSATVDLLQFDLYLGQMTLIKSGAAPTFVVRRGNVFKLSSPSFPIGILRALDAKQIDLSCEDGDLIVMVSDGAARSGDELTYLSDMLRDEKLVDEPPERIADRICRRARAEIISAGITLDESSDAGVSETEKSALVPNDDLSVVVIKVKKELRAW